MTTNKKRTLKIGYYQARLTISRRSGIFFCYAINCNHYRFKSSANFVPANNCLSGISFFHYVFCSKVLCFIYSLFFSVPENNSRDRLATMHQTDYQNYTQGNFKRNLSHECSVCNSCKEVHCKYRKLRRWILPPILKSLFFEANTNVSVRNQWTFNSRLNIDYFPAYARSKNVRSNYYYDMQKRKL